MVVQMTQKTLEKLKVKTINQQNVGSAGGWARGIEYAIKNSFDAIWIMDDDGYPDKYSLEILKNSIDEKMACISSIVLKENNHNEFVFPYPITNKNNMPVLFRWPRKISKKSELLKKVLIIIIPLYIYLMEH